MKNGILILSALFISSSIFAQTEVIKADPVVGTEEVKQAAQEEKMPNAIINFESKVVDYGLIEHNSDGNRNLYLQILEQNP